MPPGRQGSVSRWGCKRCSWTLEARLYEAEGILLGAALRCGPLLEDAVCNDVEDARRVDEARLANTSRGTGFGWKASAGHPGVKVGKSYGFGTAGPSPGRATRSPRVGSSGPDSSARGSLGVAGSGDVAGAESADHAAGRTAGRGLGRGKGGRRPIARMR